ncbi:alpha-ketoglutarate-dependent dioxygenase AlkB [Maritalea porphyrae]|uniref:Alkylated DNA repair dioxygenase n=1 Tax=Maritalea porphyrae TaxID=880732 RepID=A0ABQ5UPZ6_9HYPH|nr:alpha-ketoglutarate-dependent dioxygenase AlkB [Maritalea porphyrae]GLQ16885.1 alkylated DNA repair dioxygenase [Maritalea porphyrae]
MRIFPSKLQKSQQIELLDHIEQALIHAPLFVPKMPRTGKPFSVRMTNFGVLGWVSDQKNGYRYQKEHLETGKPWPHIPSILTDLWEELTGYPAPPEACLVNYYAPGAKMGMHQDKDEHDFDAPVLSISLGDRARFRLGGTKRGGKTSAIEISSGDVLILEKETRLAYHGIDKVFQGSSNLLENRTHFPNGGRINLTLRRVTKPDAIRSS